MKMTLTAILAAMVFFLGTVSAQETRSMIFGRVLDPQGAAVPGASVSIRNVDTGVTLTYKTNEAGYYEANLLIPGNYEVSVEMTGFKRLVRGGIVLPVSTRLEVTLHLEVGGITETVTVMAAAPLLETNAVSHGRTMENKSVMELPVMNNSALLLVKLAPVQTGGVNNYLALHSNIGGSDYSVSGNIGQNSWTLDGSPNQGPARRVAYLPYTDAVAEMKIETVNFDPSYGQTTGVAVTMISKSGTNDLHGTLTWQHWQQRWQGTPFFVKQAYYRRIAEAEAAGNTALANQLRNTDKQLPGRSNNWGISAGGPVILPKLVDGRNRLFWFLTYNGFKDVKVEDPTQFNRTVPTLKAREGDFSEMLALPNPTRYVVHDPITIRRDPARPNNFIRDPFPGNVIPKSRFVNPAYEFITKLFPKPNVTLAPGQEPVNNYLAAQTPYNWDYWAVSNRVDYQISNAWRMFGRWSANNFGPEDRLDWTYETMRGLNKNGLVRNNKGGNIDVVFTQSPTTLWDFNFGINQFREGSIQLKAREFKPSDLGLPTYLDDKAAGMKMLPLMNIAGYSQISPAGYGTWTRFRMMTFKAEVSHIRGNHTLRAALDTRQHFRTGGGGGNTSGNFGFDQTYVRRNDDTFTPASNLGLGWAAFILGIPTWANVQTNDTFAMHNPYYAWFFQDSWRITPRLTLNLGLRMEYEQGATERYNRMLGGFDPSLAIPLAASAQANYGRNPVPELPAGQFQIRGGAYYVATEGRPRRLFKNELMWLPRLGVAYQLNSRTVVRAGYGFFFDTINVLNFGPDQFGFSRQTDTVISNDFGQTWNFPAAANPANLRSPLLDPFPIRGDGTRFDQPVRTGLGAMARVGRGMDWADYNQPHARQQRWLIGVQRQIGASTVISAAYVGTYADRIALQTKLDILPAQYWADGLTRNDAVANNLNANVPNPFFIRNLNPADFPPAVWAEMNTIGFFTSSIIRKHQLLRAFPHMTAGNGLRNTADFGYYNRTHEVQLLLEKRFSRGWNFSLSYTGMYLREADFFFNEFDPKPSERESNDGRPHRLIGTGIYELPFGRGKPLLGNVGRALNLLVGGWQLAATYEYQPGPLLTFGNLFYYGSNLEDIKKVTRTWDTWFNTANFERNPARGPAAFHRRVFPTRIGGLRRDCTNQWNANLAKNLSFSERMNLQLRLDVLNVQNRSQMDFPVTDPYSTNFGRIVNQTAATNRWLQVQARLTF
jgi:hypothetical protein